MMTRMSLPLASDFLVPNASFVVIVVVVLLLGALLVGGLVWLLARRT
jgi:hypothetical protein